MEEKTLFYELLEDPAVYKLNTLDFARIFWKTAQLVVMNRSAAREEIVHPLTPAAIARALADEGVPLPENLMKLADDYRRELAGEPRDVADSIPAALRYLREINR